jgi:hypothetical protein
LVQALTRLQGLRCLRLKNCRLSSPDLAALGRGLPLLRSLALHGVVWLSHSVVDALGGLYCLQELELLEVRYWWLREGELGEPPFIVLFWGLLDRLAEGGGGTSLSSTPSLRGAPPGPPSVQAR